MIRYLLAALAIPTPALAQADLLAAHAGKARYALAGSERLFLDIQDPSSRAVFEAALGPDYGLIGGFWSDLMAGAVQLRRESGDSAETLWFNPLFDVGLATRWQRGPGEWRAIAASPVTGEALRGEPSNMVVQWDANADLKSAVEAKARASWAAGAHGGWLDRNLRDAGTAAVIRVLAARASLDRMQTSTGYAQALADVSKSLVSGDEAALPPSVRRALQLTGIQARRTLRAVSAYRRPDGWTLALQSPDAPRAAWLVDFADPAPGGRAAIKAYQLVDLGAGR